MWRHYERKISRPLGSTVLFFNVFFLKKKIKKKIEVRCAPSCSRRDGYRALGLLSLALPRIMSDGAKQRARARSVP